MLNSTPALHMSQPSHYAAEQLLKGVSVLASHPGPIKARLVAAYESHISFVKRGEIPKKWILQLDKIHERMTRYSRQHDGAELEEGSIQATVDRMPEHEAVEIAQQIFSLWDFVETSIREGRPIEG